MLRFFKFNSDVPSPVPARPAYMKRTPGKGWPEECPPLRAANAFGWDVLSATELRFRRRDGEWSLATPVELESDWTYGADDDADGEPLTQQNAWFWDRDQELPHVISPEVYPAIADQVKVSTYLFLRTDPNEILYFTDIPNLRRPFRVFSALIDTDWYPASYPWHCVLELDPSEEEIRIEKGTPLCRLFVVRRDHYFAAEMSPAEFEAYFQRTQDWLSRHGSGEKEGATDIRGAYGRLQQLSRFVVSG